MLQSIKYFQAVVQNNSFSEAAAECHISQSAISQQLKSLESELGFQLLDRKNRKFVLTPAGDYFYKKSLILIADYAQLCREAEKIARGDSAVLRIGYLRSYSSREVYLALGEFSAKYPHVSVQFSYGNHEELFAWLRDEAVDLVLNDQRRAFSDEYVNLILRTSGMRIEVSAGNPLAKLASVTAKEMKNMPCILIASKEQRKIEQEYYQTVMGIQGEFLYAENLEEAHLLVTGGQGFLPLDGNNQAVDAGSAVRRIPFYHGREQAMRNYCLFWKKTRSGCFTEEFAHILQKSFV